MKCNEAWPALVVLGLIACGDIGDSDPAFWEPSRDPGGTTHQFGAPGTPPPSGTGGEQITPPPPGAGGTWVATPPSAGGAAPLPPPNAGGTAPLPPPNAGGTAPLPPPTTTTTEPPPPPPPGNSGTCALTFSVTTVTARGRYAPDNVGAIWISDASGKFVKTLQVWGTRRLPNATAWTTVSLSNTVDAVTGATRHSHGPLQATWDCTDLSRAPVTNGSYKVNITFAESDAAIFFAPPPIMATVDFSKGSGPVDVVPPDAGNFVGMHLTAF